MYRSVPLCSLTFPRNVCVSARIKNITHGAVQIIRHKYLLFPFLQYSGRNKCSGRNKLKVPKREIFDRSDFPDFYTIKSLRVGDFGVKIKKILQNI
jgi:hypothetical protein